MALSLSLSVFLTSEGSIRFFHFSFRPVFICFHMFALPQAQQFLPLLSFMLVKAYRIHVCRVNGWSKGSCHETACGKHGAPRGPQT